MNLINIPTQNVVMKMMVNNSTNRYLNGVSSILILIILQLFCAPDLYRYTGHFPLV